jgi:hypothetical protein
MKRLIGVTLACVALAACGGKSLSGTYGVKVNSSSPLASAVAGMGSMKFQSNGTVDVTFLGTVALHTTYKVNGDQVTIADSARVLTGGQGTIDTLKTDRAGCLGVPADSSVRFCKVQ